jgi:predicted phage-related endonuclease
MSCEKIADFTAIPDWKEYRSIMRSGLDMFDADVTITGSKKTLFSVYQDKKNGIQREFKKDEESYLKAIVKEGLRGNIEDYFKSVLGQTIKYCTDTGIYRSIKNKFMLCKPLHYLEYQGTECGLIISIQDFMPREWEDVECEKVPDRNKSFAYHLMAVMGWQRVMLFIFNNWKIEIRIVEYNQQEIDDLIQAEREIWEKYIIGGIVPIVNGFDIDLIDEIHKIKKPVKKDCIDIESILIRYHQIVKEEGAVRSLSKEKETLKAKIKNFLGDAIEGYTADFIIKNTRPFSLKPKGNSPFAIKF